MRPTVTQNRTVRRANKPGARNRLSFRKSLEENTSCERSSRRSPLHQHLGGRRGYLASRARDLRQSENSAYYFSAVPTSVAGTSIQVDQGRRDDAHTNLVQIQSGLRLGVILYPNLVNRNRTHFFYYGETTISVTP